MDGQATSWERLPRNERSVIAACINNGWCRYICPADQVERLYYGFANRVLWPLFHYLIDRVPVDAAGWDAYRDVNETFADVVAGQYRDNDTIWVHDYQLMLLPALLRERLPHARIGFFLHIPFPSSEVFRILPWRHEILNGVLGADLIGFHTFAYMRHFMTSLLHVDGVEADIDRVRIGDREVRLGVFPMGIDAARSARLAADPDVRTRVDAIRREAGGRRIVLGVDRLDYTKGIPRRLEALERLLERDPELRDGMRYIQIAVPSRGEVDYVPAVPKAGRGVRRPRSTARMATLAFAADPLRPSIGVDARPRRALLRGRRDAGHAAPRRHEPRRQGVRRVARGRRRRARAERVRRRGGGAARARDGQSVRHRSVRREHPAGARPCQPRSDVRGCERCGGVSSSTTCMRGRTGSFSNSGRSAAVEQHASAARPATISVGYPRRGSSTQSGSACLLDYDGTLVPLARSPELAAPDDELLTLLEQLTDVPRIQLDIVSGRSHETLERWFGDLPITLWAEHGFWHRRSTGEVWEAARRGVHPTG